MTIAVIPKQSVKVIEVELIISGRQSIGEAIDDDTEVTGNVVRIQVKRKWSHILKS